MKKNQNCIAASIPLRPVIAWSSHMLIGVANRLKLLKILEMYAWNLKCTCTVLFNPPSTVANCINMHIQWVQHRWNLCNLFWSPVSYSRNEFQPEGTQHLNQWFMPDFREGGGRVARGFVSMHYRCLLERWAYAVLLKYRGHPWLCRSWDTYVAPGFSNGHSRVCGGHSQDSGFFFPNPSYTVQSVLFFFLISSS